MIYKLIVRKIAQWLAFAMLLGFGLAMAQTEPTLNQVYATAQAGKLDEAQGMIEKVLVAHPKSGKAYFVRAELFARQGKLDLARESLASAEKFSPGLPFAKSETIQALRAQISSKTGPKAVGSPAVNDATSVTPASPASSSFSWSLPLLLAGGAIVGGYFIFRRKAPAPMAVQAGYANQREMNAPQGFGMNGGGVQPGYANQGGLNGPQVFGTNGGGAQTGHPQQASSPQPGYPPQTGSGLGGRIMGGVATGLAVGAGVMAAEAIARNVMGNHNPASPAAGPHTSNLDNNDFQPINKNPDMGGTNFGVEDTGSWDDAGSGDAGGGSDWDN